MKVVYEFYSLMEERIYNVELGSLDTAMLRAYSDHTSGWVQPLIIRNRKGMILATRADMLTFFEDLQMDERIARMSADIFAEIGEISNWELTGPQQTAILERIQLGLKNSILKERETKSSQ